MVVVKLIGAKEFETAIKRNPKVVIEEGQKMIQRTKAHILSLLKRAPWEVGNPNGKGKGIPFASGNLRDRSVLSKFVGPLSAKIYVNETKAKYAVYVHEGTNKMDGRPFLDVAKQDAKPFIRKKEREFLDKVVKELAK